MTPRSLRATAVAAPALLLLTLLPAVPASATITVAPMPSSRAADVLRLDVDGPTGGRAALRAIEGRVAQVAELNGLTAARLSEIMRGDSTAYLTGGGRLFYRDAVHAPRNAPVQPGVAPFPDADTFVLHSKPGSQRTIYLDFDGVTVANTFWNSAQGGGLPDGSHVGFSLDGDTTAFNDAERATIQQVWQSVAEDYAPFDVDVTTEAPPAAAIDRSGPGDQVFGTVAAVTGSVEAHARLCEDEGCTGIAFLDVFDEPSVHADLQPAWAFTAYFDDVFSIAETITHEVGHNFGLDHDGNNQVDYYAGHNGWAPIMGSGYVPITQWSKGDYAHADNRQDDLAIIAAGGAPVRADAAGGSVGASAPALPTGIGVIASRADVDVYLVGTCTGPISVTGATAYAMPDLDMKLTLLDASGVELASANPVSAQVNPTTASGMGATVSHTATGAPVYVAVDGVGRGTPTTGYDDYGSIGSYRLTRSGSCDGATATAPGAVQGLTASGTTTSVTVSWTPPATTGGAAIERYEVSLDGAVVGEVATSGTTITGQYAAGSTHTVGVRAASSAGFGPSAQTSFTVPGPTPVPVSAPGAPTGLAARSGRAGGPKSVVLAWRAPASTGGSAITAYTVYLYRVRGSRSSYVGSLGARPATSRGLELRVDAGRYRFRVKARNVRGLGAFSAYSPVATAR